MEALAAFVFSLYGMFLLVCAILLVYLIIRRINLKDQETFEKRDN